MTIESRLREARIRVERRVGEKESFEARQASLTDEIGALVDQIALLEKAGMVLSSIGEERQQSTQDQIETLVTQGLQSIFDQELSFHIVSTMRGKSNTVDFMIRSKLGNGRIVETPVMEARGGGLAATVGFLLRVVVLLLSRKGNESVTLFLDETFGMVSQRYEIKLAEFLRELVDKTGIQIILVTHSNAYSETADKQYSFTLVDGLTKITEE